MAKWKTLSSMSKYKNPWIEVKEDKVLRPDGKEGIYGFINVKNAVSIIALDNESYIYFITEFRYPLQKYILSIPGGSFDPNLTPEELARKELHEETGIKAGHIEQLGFYLQDPALLTYGHHCFLATNLDISELNINEQLDADITKISKLHIDDVKQKIILGDIQCAKTLSALALLFSKLY